MTQDETGWSEKGKSSGGASSGKGQRPPREPNDAATEAPQGDAATPTRPSKRDTDSADTSDTERTVVRRPSAGDDGARKVARAAATAGQRDVSFTTRLGFPALVAIVCLLGIGTVFYAWTTRDALATPRQNLDHWHSVYGVYDCTQEGDNKYLPVFLSSQDETGIHSHGDGIMHVHPFFELSSGLNAQMRHWFNEMQISMTDTELVLDNGRTLTEGVECADGSGPAELSVLHWDFDFQALNDEPPSEVHNANFGEIKFDNDREVYILAFAAAGTDFSNEAGTLPPPDRFDMLNNVSSALEYTPTELVPVEVDE